MTAPRRNRNNEKCETIANLPAHAAKVSVTILYPAVLIAAC